MFEPFVVETSLTTKYNRTWLPDIRELLQNGFDGIRQDFSHLEPFVPSTSQTKGPDGGFRSTLCGRDNSLLLEIVSSKSSVVLRQRRKPGNPLPRTALYMYSEKNIARGDLGGFGEGLKICALQLLKNDCGLQYVMSGEMWTFFLKEHQQLKAKVLAVRIEPSASKAHAEMLEIVVTHRSNDCRHLFVPNRFLRLVPQPLLFSGKQCQFLDVAGKNGTCVLFVNGIMMKKTASISFSVNLRLSVDKLSPDRDSLRTTEAYESYLGICSAIFDSDSQENRFKAQRLCLEVLERCKGVPREDLKYLVPRERMCILEFLRHEKQNPRLFPIVFDAPERRKQTYRLLNYTPYEMHSAPYFSESLDFDRELAEVVSKAPLSSIPSDQEIQADLESLQKALDFVNSMFSRYGGRAAFSVKFVDFQVFLTEPITHQGVVYLHGGLFDRRTVRHHFREYCRGQVFILLLSMAVVMNPGTVDRRVLAHIQFQMGRLVNERNVVLADMVGEGIFGEAVKSPPKMPLLPYAPPNQDSDPTVLISDKLDRRAQGLVPEQTGGDDQNKASVAAAPDYDDSVPLMERIWMRDVSLGLQIPLFVGKGNASFPQNLFSISAPVRRMTELLVGRVFPKLKSCLFFCYFQSRIMAYFEHRTTSIYINLYFCSHFVNMRELFLTICHELAHLSGFHGHDSNFANAMGKIVLDHSAAFAEVRSIV